jgi:hypothetical protein
MTDGDGPRQFGPLDSEICRLRLVSDQLHTAAQDVGRLWFDSWHGPASNAFGEVRDRLAARPRRVGDLVDDALDALTDYRAVLAERPASSADGELLIAWRQRLAAAGMSAADMIRLVNRELAELAPIMGEPAPAPRPGPEAAKPRPLAGRQAERPTRPVAAELPPPNHPSFSDHTAAVCDELLDAEFGELDEDD